MSEIICELSTVENNYSAEIILTGFPPTISLTVAQETVEVNLAVGMVGEKGDPGDQRVFVQEAQPDFNGLTGLWVQTGLTDDGITLWIEDGVQ